MGFSVEGKVALVTGANRGIGKAIVESFLAHGAKKVYLAVRNTSSTTEISDKYGDRVTTIAFDAENEESIIAAANYAKDVDVVVNNAGVLEIADPLSENVIDALKHEMDVNVYGLLRVANAFTPVLAEKDEAAFVQLNSVASILNFTDFTTYSASKAASYSITQGLNSKLKPLGVQVLSVHPGPIATDMADKAGFESGESVTSVSEGIVAALAVGDFHLFPDEVSKQFEAAYQSYSDAFITAEAAE